MTINYWLELSGKPTKPSKDMTQAELDDPKNPYNTHGKPGLPPAPINNPGKAALKGAMNPPAGPWLFFVAIDKKGHRRSPRPSTSTSANIEAWRKTRTACLLDAADVRRRAAVLRQADRALALAGDPQRRVRRGRADRLALHRASSARRPSCRIWSPAWARSGPGCR